MKKHKPWLDKNGKPLGVKSLRRLSREWNADTWNDYLESLSSRVPDEEALTDPSKLEEVSMASAQHAPSVSEQLEDTIREQIEKLPAKQRYVIEEEFYLGRGQRPIAEDLEISRRMVRKLRKAALASLSSVLRVNR